MQALTLGPIDHFSAEECRGFNAEIDFERRSRRAWEFFTRLESNWDRQGGTGKIELFP